MQECTLTWGRDSDRRVDPPGGVGANGDGGVSHSGLGQIRKNSAGRKVRRFKCFWWTETFLTVAGGELMCFSYLYLLSA